MKDNPMNFGWNHYYRPLPKPLQQLLSGLKMFIGVIAGASFINDRPTLAFWLLVSGAGIDFILNFFAEAPVESLEKASTRLERDKPEVEVEVHIEEKENGI